MRALQCVLCFAIYDVSAITFYVINTLGRFTSLNVPYTSTKPLFPLAYVFRCWHEVTSSGDFLIYLFLAQLFFLLASRDALYCPIIAVIFKDFHPIVFNYKYLLDFTLWRTGSECSC